MELYREYLEQYTHYRYRLKHLAQALGQFDYQRNEKKTTIVYFLYI